MTRKITATFVIPKNKIKNANVPLDHIVGSLKSAWIREYSEKVWADAARYQFGITANEPLESEWKINKPSQDAQNAMQEIESLQKKVDETKKSKEKHDSLYEDHKSNKALLRKEKKKDPKSTLVSDLEDKIADYNHQTEVIKASMKRNKANLSAAKKRFSSETQKELNKIERANRRLYIEKKLELNKDQHLFQKCAVIVTVHNITNREFDSPNFYPTVKPILDGCTDTGIVWPDDNNSIIQGGVLFLSGRHQQRDNYVFEIEITSDWPWK